MRSIGEKITLLPLSIFVKLREKLWDQQIAHKYHNHRRFNRTEKIFHKAYSRLNPYTLTRRYIEKIGGDVADVYGETPLHTMEKMARAAQVSIDDHFYELGCGRGRSAFFIKNIFRCRVTGIEIIPKFIEINSFIQEKANLKNIRFLGGSYLDIPLNEATVIYYYGTCSSDVEIEQISKRLDRCRSGTRVLSISEPLPLKNYVVIEELPVQFAWGWTTCYIQKRNTYI